MPHCGVIEKKIQQDEKIQYSGQKVITGEGNLNREPKHEPVEPCINDLIEKGEVRKMFMKWNKLKRVRDMYDEQVSMKKAECFRKKILKHMKKRIVEMPVEERKAWLNKLIRLAFLHKLKEVKELKAERRQAFLSRLEHAKDEERDLLFKKLDQLKDLHELKELDDVNQMLAMQEEVLEKKRNRAKEFNMRIRLNRLKKLEDIKRKEEKMLRDERVEKMREIVSMKKNWQGEMIKRIENMSKNLVGDLVSLQDKLNWYEQIYKEVEEEKIKLIEEEKERSQTQEMADMIAKEKELAKLKRDEKIKEIEAWKKEKKLRLWKLDRVKKFEEFLENRYKVGEENEHLFFKKIFNKLKSTSKLIPVDPWEMRLKMDQREVELNRRKKINNWINSIISSNKNKVVKSVKLKKYLEVMETPQFDSIYEEALKINTVEYIMVIVRDRIFKNTFSEKTKHYYAKEYGLMATKAKLDIRDIDPTDKLLSIQITTKNYQFFINTGEEYLILAQQKFYKPKEPCQDKTDVLCLTKNERDKMLELIEKRNETRKVIKDRRLKEYEICQNRMALDDAWMNYMKKAYKEAIKDLDSCRKGDEDIVKIEVKEPTQEQIEASGSKLSRLSEKRSEKEIASLKFDSLVTSKHGLAMKMKKDRVKMDYNKAMDERLDRLNKYADDTYNKLSKIPFYRQQKVQFNDILKKEKVVRQYAIKDLPKPEQENR